MKFSTFFKYYNLAMAIMVGIQALKHIYQSKYDIAAILVICTAIHHFWYDVYRRKDGQNKK